MSKTESLAWFDGKVLPLQDVRVSPLSHSLHYGTGVFEGIRCYAQEGGGGGVFRLDDHLDRLLESAKVLGYQVPFTRQQLAEAVVGLLRENAMEAAYVRPLAWLGEGGMGVAGGDNPVHTLIACWEWGPYLGEDALKKGVRVLITGYERATGNAIAQRAKVTGQYVTSFMAKRHAKGLGQDEALLLDRDGFLAEGAGENLFLVSEETLVTPPADAPILRGITRHTVLTLARDLGIPTVERRFTRTDLYAAQEAFLTGTAAEVTPIRKVDGRALLKSPGKVTKAIQEAYQAVVSGAAERSADWVTRVGTGR